MEAPPPREARGRPHDRRPLLGAGAPDRSPAAEAEARTLPPLPPPLPRPRGGGDCTARCLRPNGRSLTVSWVPSVAACRTPAGPSPPSPPRGTSPRPIPHTAGPGSATGSGRPANHDNEATADAWPDEPWPTADDWPDPEDHPADGPDEEDPGQYPGSPSQHRVASLTRPSPADDAGDGAVRGPVADPGPTGGRPPRPPRAATSRPAEAPAPPPRPTDATRGKRNHTGDVGGAGGHGADPAARPLVVTEDEGLLDDLLRLCAAAGAEAEVSTGRRSAGSGRRAPRPGRRRPHETRRRRMRRRPGVLLVGRDLDDRRSGARRGPRRRAVCCSCPATSPGLSTASPTPPKGGGRTALTVGRGRRAGRLRAPSARLRPGGDRRPAGHRTMLVDGDPLGGGLDVLPGAESAGARGGPRSPGPRAG